MAAIQISDVEWELLAGEPAELLKLYVALKRRMDFATGVAGIKTLINEIVLRDALSVDAIPGRPKPKPVTREQHRSAVRRMEKIGLLTVIGPLVFEFPHARRDSSNQNSYNRTTTELQPELQPAKNTQEPSKHALSSESNEEAATGLFFEKVPSNNLLPVSGNTYTQRNACVRELDSRQRFSMADTWEPTPNTFAAVLRRNGMTGANLNPDLLLEFRSYWIAQPDKHHTQAQWEHKLAQQLKRNHQKTEGTPHEANRRNAQRRTRNAIDTLHDNNW